MTCFPPSGSYIPLSCKLVQSSTECKTLGMSQNSCQSLVRMRRYASASHALIASMELATIRGPGGLDMVYAHVTLIAFLTLHSMIAPMLIASIATLDLEPGIEQVPRGALATLSTCFYAFLSSCSYMHLQYRSQVA